MGSLLRLDEIKNATTIKVLTQNPDKKEKDFLPRAVKDFMAERPQFEFREHVGRDVHDRYIVSADELILLGHGTEGYRGQRVVRRTT